MARSSAGRLGRILSLVAAGSLFGSLLVSPMAYAADPVTVTGVVVDDDTGDPIPGADVTLFVVDPEDGYLGDGWASTDGSGSYSFDLEPGVTYTLWVNADGYHGQYHGEVDGEAGTFTLEDLTGGQFPVQRLTRLAVGTVSGTLTENGVPVQWGGVEAYRWSDTQWDWTASAGTDEDGRYSIELEPGSYTFAFSAEVADGDYVTYYLDGGTSLPGEPDDANSVEVEADATVTVDFEFPGGVAASGTVTGPSGPLAGARVQLYAYDTDSGEWSYTGRQVLTTTDGSFTFARLTGAGPFTLRVVRSGHAVGFLGGGEAFSPPTAQNSFDLTGGDSTGLDVTLVKRVSTLGKVAGQNLAYCLANELPPNDDGSSDAVDIPFNLRYFGNSYTQLYVNNNGNVTFDSPLSQYTPDALDGGQSKPIIAPFFADVDTSDSEESDIVTYGASPDGSQFCVNWIDVEPFSGTSQSGKLNSFQLLLTKRENVAGRASGDFDITFNYDQIQWDTGNVSNVSAGAGYASGTGEDGTYFQLTGSLVDGAFPDGGANALVAGRQNSSQDGRYIFEVRNDGYTSSLGSVTGRVLLPTGAPAVDAYVEVVSASRAYYSTTNAAGSYTLGGVAAGTYTVRAWPPTSGLIQAGTTAVVQAGETTTVNDIQFTAPAPMPANVGLSSSTFGQAAPGQVPTVTPWEPLTLSYTGSAGGTANYAVIGLDGGTIRSGILVEQSAGQYRGIIPDLSGASGNVTVRIIFTPSSGSVETIAFTIYIDPSGTVVDQWGFPIAGATVTLLRSETPDGDYLAVPDGSDLMSERNRSNPDQTDANGVFGWDVTAAWYRVKAEKSGYTTFTSDAMQVPPERLDLVFQLAGGSAPAPQATITGSAEVGGTLQAHAPTGLGADFLVTGHSWYRGDEQIAGANTASYTVVAADQGEQLHVELTIGRERTPVDPLHPLASLLEFSAFTAASAPVTVAGSPSPTLTVPTSVSVSGDARVNGLLTANAGAWGPAPVDLAYQWLRGATPIAGATAQTYTVAAADVGAALSVRVTGSKAGYPAVSKTSAVTPVVPKALKLKTTPTPKINGTARVGSTLTVSKGTWKPKPVPLTVQWFRAGVAAPIATGNSYQLTADDKGKKITVKVTGAKVGYASVTKSKTTKKAVAAGKLTTAKPKISGSAKVGSTLTVSPGTWKPAPVGLSYQWLRNGRKISGATGSAYLLTADDKGKRITVKVTGTKAGYTTASKTSKATKQVAA